MDVDLQRLKRSWTRDLGRLWFLIKADLGDLEPDESDLVERSAGLHHELGAHGNPVKAEEWVKTEHGWTGLLVDADTIEHWMEWLTRLAASFGGFTDGSIVGAPSSAHPSPGVREPVPMAFISYNTSDLTLVPKNDRPPGWFVEENLTRYLSEKTLGWTYLPGELQYFGRDDHWIRPESPDYEQALAEAIPRFLPASVACVTTTKPVRYRMANFWTQGQAQYHQHETGATWETHLDQLRKILLWTPPRTRYGWIAYERAGLSSPNPSPAHYPHVEESDVDYNIPLLSSFVPDASGLQLLTNEHLARAHDLSDWDIEHLAGGRHLVQAPDLSTWYSTPHPDPDVLAKARADFGDMILTPELIQTNRPWRD
ncbi:hypothetical protein D9V37_19915 [Nocardioides mangrovicus]|uniref:Uncharacterized protein n=1 Tax=Nocardioides mangrovicus TaxID=2478913 RepID=A0A3L8P1L7_9ACTN|nr:hypothetical protein [Nocardioides mangrovicus]RLV48308.1 hypothetical protein D9V37_19915 [Nocardioides mangrovicus]